MFKKPFAVRGRSVLRESEKRRLRLAAAATLAGGGSDEAAAAAAAAVLAELLPSKRADVEVLRVTTHQGVYLRVYLTAGEPVLVELERPAGALAIFPTVHTLARLAPAALPPLLTHGALLPVLRRGADLMAPGVVYPDGGPAALGLRRGEVRALWARGYAAPVAVGVMNVGADSPAALFRMGRAFTVLHVHGDLLWQMGAKTALPAVPPGTVGPVPPPYAPVELAPDRDPDDAADAAGDVHDHDDDDSAAFADSADAVPWQTGAGAEEPDADEPDEPDEADAADADAEPPAVAAPAEPVVDMDTLLEAALLLALRRSVKDKDLPMLASTFYAQHIIPAQPRGLSVDIKQSSHKKLAKFLAAMEKEGLIKTKETKGVLSIVGIVRTHEKLTRFRPSEWTTEADAGAAAAGPAAPAAPASKEVQVVELYRPTSTFAPMFEVLGRPKTDYFSFADVRAALNDYVTRHQLVDAENPRMVVLDPFLAEHLVPKNDRAAVFKAPRDGLANTLATKLHTFHQVTTPGGGAPEVRRGAARPIEIWTEQRGGNKTVTRIAGLEGFGLDPEKFAKDMQKKLACSSTVAPVPGKQASGLEVQLQGSVASELGEHLASACGVPRRFITIKGK